MWRSTRRSKMHGWIAQQLLHLYRCDRLYECAFLGFSNVSVFQNDAMHLHMIVP